MPLQDPRLQYFLDFFPAETGEQLRSFLNQHRHDRAQVAFWLWDGEQPMLGLFINRIWAALYYEPQAAWSSTGSKEESGNTLEFVLENGQLDQFPVEFVIPADDAVDAFVEFFTSNRLSKRIRWA